MSRREAFAPGLYVGVLADLPGIGPASVRRAIERLGGVLPAWEASPEEWEQALGQGLPPPAREALRAGRRPEALRRLAARLSECGAVAVTPWDPDGAYPANLRHMPDMPVVLYVRGSLLPEDRLAVAIVGSRRASPDGRLAAGTLARELASRGYTVVSGLAVGVDAAAHRGAIQAGGRTIGVLGCGIDRVYPPGHRPLFDEVVKHGAVVSEYPPGTEPHRWRFAARNRIIAGLSLAVVVAEARERSGAISTAECADRLSRAAMAMPGHPFLESARGSNGLLRDGAGFCADALDVEVAVRPVLARMRRAEEAGLLPAAPPAGTSARSGADFGAPPWAAPASTAGRAGGKGGASRTGGMAAGLAGPLRDLYEMVRRGPCHAEELVSATGLPTPQVVGYMTRLEAAGLIRRRHDGRWAASGAEIQ